MKHFEIGEIKIQKNAEGFYDVYVGGQILMEMLSESEVKGLTIGSIEQVMKDAGDYHYGGYSGIQELLEDLEEQGHEIYDWKEDQAINYCEDAEADEMGFLIMVDVDGFYGTELFARAYPDGSLYIYSEERQEY